MRESIVDSEPVEMTERGHIPARNNKLSINIYLTNMPRAFKKYYSKISIPQIITFIYNMNGILN